LVWFGYIIPMEIGFDIRFASRPGGGGVYVRRLLTHLVKMYPQEHWRLYYNSWCGNQRKVIQGLEEFAGDRGHIELVPVQTGVLSLRQHLEFRKVPMQGDLYHYPHFDLPLGIKGTAVVATIHDLYPLTDKRYCSGTKRAYFHYLSKRSCKRAARIIAVSEYTKNEIIKHLAVPAEKIAVVPQSQDTGYHPIDDGEILSELREKYKLPERFIFYTGNHKRHKNLARLLEAYSRLKPPLRQAYKLVITGGITRETEQLKVQAMQLGIEKEVHFTGWVRGDDLAGLYNLASLVVLPSLYEGFGYTTLEAMACGKPVVCSKGGAIPEVVGAQGQMFDPYNTEQMSERITEALEKDVDNPEVRKKMLEQSGKFSPQQTARMTYEVYKEVASY